jgi:N-acetylneuraminic acid mutarotase
MRNKIAILLFMVGSVLPVFSGTWLQRSSFGGVGRHRAVGVSIHNKGYIGLGHVNGTGVDISYKDWWEYDPASNSWTQKADFPIADHGAVAFSVDKKGYVGGGSYLNGEFWCYDPQMNTWTPIATCPITPGDMQGFNVGNKGYVYQYSEIAEYDPATNTWTQMADAPVSFMAWCCAFSVGSSGFIKSGASFYEFKPSQNTWIMRASCPGTMSNGSYAFSVDNKGYVTCGFSGGLSNVVDEVWSYNPGDDSWSYEGEFPGTSRRFPVAFAIGEKGYFGTGTNGVNMNDFWQFDLRNLGSFEEEISFEIYPNPSTEIVFVRFDATVFYGLEEPKVELIDVNGRVVRTIWPTAPEFSVEKRDLASGHYVLNVYSGKKIISKRVLFN